MIYALAARSNCSSVHSSRFISTLCFLHFLLMFFFSTSNHFFRKSSSCWTLSTKASRFSYCAWRTIEGIVNDSFDNSPAVPRLLFSKWRRKSIQDTRHNVNVTPCLLLIAEKTWVSGLHSWQICFYDVWGLANFLKIIVAAMGRPLRIEYPDAFYHITGVTGSGLDMRQRD